MLEYLAKCLVDSPDEVSVSVIEEDSVIVFELTVAEDDIGKVIGRRGRAINALRTVVNACGVKEGKRVVIEVLD